MLTKLGADFASYLRETQLPSLGCSPDMSARYTQVRAPASPSRPASPRTLSLVHLRPPRARLITRPLPPPQLLVEGELRELATFMRSILAAAANAPSP